LNNAEYRDGVQCSVCHRTVDPVYSAENPDPDPAIIAAIDPPLDFIGSGALIIDPQDRRRGPRNGVSWGHQAELSPYHRDAALCGSCHDINNPVLSWDSDLGEYALNDIDQPADDQSELFPVERTYSEWLNSAFPGEDTTCQTCHFERVTGPAAIGSLTYPDVALHDMTGGNTWVPQAILAEADADFGRFNEDFAGEFGMLRRQGLEAGIERARTMLQEAATLDVTTDSNQLSVKVTNETGHKLPTGYPEGRRMWLQIEGYDAADNLIYTSGAYNVATGDLDTSGQFKVYEIEQGITENLASQIPGLSAGPSFHFALNNQILNDNRIPPRGFTNAAFTAVKAEHYEDGEPAVLYADGVYWDITGYTLPANVTYGVVRLLYQTASKEYIEFLRDNDPNAGGPEMSHTEILYQLWLDTERSKPEVMAEATFTMDGGGGTPTATPTVTATPSATPTPSPTPTPTMTPTPTVTPEPDGCPMSVCVYLPSVSK
jgi:hypothetical protein